MASEEQLGLTVSLQNSKAVELVDLGKSFEAFGKLYEEFVHAKGYDSIAGNAKLYIVKIREGSIIADLKALLDQASFVADHKEILAGFMANLQELIDFFRGQADPKKAPAISTTEAKNLGQVFEPVAKDGGAQINFSIHGNTAPVTVNNIVVNSERANALQNNIRRFLGPDLPENGTFEKEVLYLEQMRGDSRSRVGDRGIIEKYSSKPVKLHFMTPDVKAEIVDKPRNPFRVAYIVDGSVRTAKGEPALYKISGVHAEIRPAHRVKSRTPAKAKKRPKRSMA